MKPPGASQKGKFNMTDFIVNKHRLIEKIFIVLILLSLICLPFINVNYDLTEYLPASAPTKQGINLMEQEFGYPGTARVMLEDVTLYQAKVYKDQMQAVDGVDQVMWCDTGGSIYQSSDFIDYSSLDDYYKDGCAVMDITFVEGDTSRRTEKAIDQLREICGEKGRFVGTAVQDYALSVNLVKEINMAMILAVVCIALILTLTTTSWFEPVLFLVIMGIAILINSGTNIFIGTISFMTKSAAAILQLAIAMDYSIFLLHSFTKEKAAGQETSQALVNAVRHSVSSIMASGATTIVGFLVLCLMKFSIGFDLGIVLAKGIVISLITVLFLMPALILRWAPLIEKTAHKPFLPKFERTSRGIFHIRWAVLVLCALVVVPAFAAQNMNDFTFGNDAVGAGPGTQVYEDEQAIDAVFGKSNMILAIVPNTSSLTEKEMAQELKALPFMKSVTSLPDTLPAGVPEHFLPQSLTSQLHTEDYARILMYMRSKNESEYAFQCSDTIQSVVKKYYPENSYVVGMTPSTQDIKEIITSDYNFVNPLSILGVALVIIFTFRSFLIPLLVLIPIELAIFVNMAFPYLTGTNMIYIGYIIVSCLQLGATVDYSILMTNNYLDRRLTMEKKEACIDAIRSSLPSILTSASILTVVGYLLYFTSSIGAIGDLGHLIGRGALFSMLLVATLLPILLYAFDKPITQRARQQKRRERLNRIRSLKFQKSRQMRREEQKKRLRAVLKKYRHRGWKVHIKEKRLSQKRSSLQFPAEAPAPEAQQPENQPKEESTHEHEQKEYSEKK